MQTFAVSQRFCRGIIFRANVVYRGKSGYLAAVSGKIHQKIPNNKGTNNKEIPIFNVKKFKPDMNNGTYNCNTMRKVGCFTATFTNLILIRFWLLIFESLIII